jgi:hypothetical protein
MVRTNTDRQGTTQASERPAPFSIGVLSAASAQVAASDADAPRKSRDAKIIDGNASRNYGYRMSRCARQYFTAPLRDQAVEPMRTIGRQQDLIDIVAPNGARDDLSPSADSDF